MKIYFDTSFDHSAWPGPLAEKQASFGEVWTGTAGLLGILETRLGLVGPKLCNAERAAGLISSLQQKKGFWNESCANDPFTDCFIYCPGFVIASPFPGLLLNSPVS